MTVCADDAGRSAARGGILARMLLLVAFGAACFLAGRLWALREVKAAQRAASLAEQERLAFQAELIECRNALLLEKDRVSPGDGPAAHRSEASRDRAAGEPQDRAGR